MTSKLDTLTVFVHGCNFNSHTREGVTDGDEDDNTEEEDFNSHTREGVTS